MREEIRLKGEYIIAIIDAKTQKQIKCEKIKNQLTSINQDIRSQMLMGTYEGEMNALQIKYFAFGNGETSGNNAPSATDTALNNEIYRKQITKIAEISPGVVQSIVSLGSLECNETITEIGIFCGNEATSEANSGTLLSRTAVTLEKNSNIVLNIVRTDTCTI